jgi:hypothetical protein
MTGFTFAAPLALLGLLALPAIYWLLRVTPPSPREVYFPPVRLLRGLIPEERTPAKTPWPLLLLRLAIAALAALALAGPVWNPSAAPAGAGPVLLILDDGWAAAPDWEKRLALAEKLLAEAGRNANPAALMPISQAAAAPQLMEAAKAMEQLRALRPKPWLPEREPAAAQVASFAREHRNARLAWISDGLEQGGAAGFAAALLQAAQAGASLETYTGERTTLALQNVVNQASGLEAAVLRAGPKAKGAVEALDEKGRVIATAPFSFDAAGGKTSVKFDLPVELRNDATLLRITEENSAGAVGLLDARARVRRVAVVSGAAEQSPQPLLSADHYLAKALAPFAQLSSPPAAETDPVLAALGERPNVLVLADVNVAPGDATEAASAFLEQGGVLIRFAGPRLANANDDLTPVRLRRNGRVLGGAMSWETPKRLAEFEPSSPFFGLPAPAEITVTRQLLAEPDPGLSAQTWARLADGTPLVTFERRGKGLIVLFHVSADMTWSNLPISGLFVDMLQRLCALSGEGAAQSGGEKSGDRPALAPLRTLDGFGVLGAPGPTAKPISPDFHGRADSEHPPGFYGTAGSAVALQTVAADDALNALDFGARGLAPSSLETGGGARDLRPALLGLIFVFLLVDWLALLRLSGRLRPAAALVLALCAILAGPDPQAQAAEPQKSASAQRDREAALKTRLAYVVTGDQRIDETSRLGLEALSRVLDQRTSFSPGEPMGVDVSRDELAFFPMLYWPINAAAPQPDARTVARVAAYMRQGGTVVFDTRDALLARANASPTPETLWLREMAKGLDLPPLEVAPRDHVITKTFYLLDGFIGRYANGDTWVEALPTDPPGGAARPVRATDNVSAVVITSNDLAAGWAQDKSGQPLYPLTPGGARQRELSLRGGVNLVMYTLTGNYKSDQVHVRDLLQRLGQ